MEPDKILAALTPEIVEKFKSAIETGKWPDGKIVSKEQLAICMQAVIAFEHAHLPEHERTGYIPPKPARDKSEASTCASANQEVATIKWQDDTSVT